MTLCLGLACNTNSIAFTAEVGSDSLPVLAGQEIKPIRLTEAGARQVLRDRADLIMLRGVVVSQDTLLAQQRRVIRRQDQTITELNHLQQGNQNTGQVEKSQADYYQQQWRGARRENWLWRGAVVLYVIVRLKLI